MKSERPERPSPLHKVTDGPSRGARDDDLFGGLLRQFAFPLIIGLAALALNMIEKLLGLPDWARSGPYLRPAVFIVFLWIIVRGGYKSWLTIDDQARADPRIKPWARVFTKYGMVGVAASLATFGMLYFIDKISWIDRAPPFVATTLGLLSLAATITLGVSMIAGHLGTIYMHSPDGIYRSEDDPQ